MASNAPKKQQPVEAPKASPQSASAPKMPPSTPSSTAPHAAPVSTAPRSVPVSLPVKKTEAEELRSISEKALSPRALGALKKAGAASSQGGAADQFALFNALSKPGLASSIGSVDSFANYLDMQSPYYMSLHLPFLSSQDLASLISARSQVSNARSDFLSNSTRLVNDNDADNSGGRQAASTDVVLRSIDKQSQSIGKFSVGLNEAWCVLPGSSQAYTIRYSSAKKHDLMCVSEDPNFLNMYVSSFGDNGFLDSYAISLDKFFIRDASGAIVGNQLEYRSFRFTYSMFTGDFNGDGKDEIGTSHPDGLRIYHEEEPFTWYSRSGAAKDGWCTYSGAQVPVQESGIRVGDFNGDGKADLWCHNKGTGVNTVRFNGYTLDGNRHDYKWFEPAFSLSGTPWCQGGEVIIGDFNGDSRSDVACFKSATTANLQSVQLLYSLGDGRFVSPTGVGSGTIPLGSNQANTNKFETWDNGLRSFNISYMHLSNRLKAADIDGDGSDDLIHVSNTGQVKVLFASDTTLFQTRSSATHGLTSVNGLTTWCPKTEATILAKDFNGDGKADLACMQLIRGTTSYYTPMNQLNPDLYSNQLMLSDTKPASLTQGLQFSIRITDFRTNQVNARPDQLKINTETITCDNTVRPDDKLTYSSAPSLKPKEIESLSTESFIRPNTNANYMSYFDGSVQVQVKHNGTTYAKSLQVRTNPTQGSEHLSLTDSPSSAPTQVSMAIKSGECIKMSMITMYLSQVDVPYQATAQIKVRNVDGTVLAGDKLLQSLKQFTISTPPSINQNDPTEGLVQVSGTMRVNLITDSSSKSTNCFQYNYQASPFTPDFMPQTVFQPSPESQPQGAPVPAPIAVPTSPPMPAPTGSCSTYQLSQKNLIGMTLSRSSLDCSANVRAYFDIIGSYSLPILIVAKQFEESQICRLNFAIPENNGRNPYAYTIDPEPKDCASINFKPYAGSGFETPYFPSLQNITGVQIKIMDFTINNVYSPINQDVTCGSFQNTNVTRTDQYKFAELAMMQDVTLATGGTYYILDEVLPPSTYGTTNGGWPQYIFYTNNDVTNPSQDHSIFTLQGQVNQQWDQNGTVSYQYQGSVLNNVTDVVRGMCQGWCGGICIGGEITPIVPVIEF